MSVLELVLSTWLLITVSSMALAISIGVFKISRAAKCRQPGESEQLLPPLEVLVPIKGVFPNQEEILRSLLTQDYPNFHLSFILENEQDPANEVVESLCHNYPHARKVLSGPATLCAQKNHNLVAGVKALRTDTEIVVLCDSTNKADSDWLKRFVKPLVTNEIQVVTTFRAFQPEPETIGGVCQAIYAALLRTLATMKPTPWGGATALRRTIVDKPKVLEMWSRTVVDDLVLGNVLEEAGVKVLMDPCNLLASPLPGQSVQGFLAYLDRQVLFPKFTNPGIWLLTVSVMLNLALAIVAAVILGAMFVAGLAPTLVGWASVVFWLGLLAGALLLRHMNPSQISARSWLKCVPPCILLAAFICLRSVFVNHIDWHGLRYWPGKAGVVLRTERLSGDRH
ncbi:MAG: glycosyltransferase [Desulfomonile tiedjei]|nr:glycosyltransferase [Desulfomonile tiedjei]